jgi:diketogulonate reductase-like aldo/keto reductase
MAENLNVFDFTLDDQDMARITAFDTGRSIIGWPWYLRLNQNHLKLQSTR